MAVSYALTLFINQRFGGRNILIRSCRLSQRIEKQLDSMLKDKDCRPDDIDQGIQELVFVSILASTSH